MVSLCRFSLYHGKVNRNASGMIFFIFMFGEYAKIQMYLNLNISAISLVNLLTTLAGPVRSGWPHQSYKLQLIYRVGSHQKYPDTVRFLRFI